MQTPSSLAILFFAAIACSAGCQTTAPVKTLQAKPLAEITDEQLSAKQLQVVGNSRYESIALRSDHRFAVTMSASGGGHGSPPMEGNWQRRGDQILLLYETTGELRSYAMCKIKDLNGQVCLYHESEGQFVDKRARETLTQSRRAMEAQLMQSQ